MKEPERLLRAAATIRDCRDELSARGSDILRETMGDTLNSRTSRKEEWRRYPDGEAYDPVSHAQYFYHSHSANNEEHREHGHFHLFVRAEGMPAGITPLLLPELAIAGLPVRPQAAPRRRGKSHEVSHLVAIALDRCGEPIRLFTTNRWVTGETWYRAEDVARMVDRFSVENAEPAVMVLNRWLGAVVQLFRPQISKLLLERDRKVTEWGLRHKQRMNAFEDPKLEMTSSETVDLDARLVLVERSAAETQPIASRVRLPPMAEGWGS